MKCYKTTLWECYTLITRGGEKMDYTKIYNEELIALVKEKIKSVGEIKAVKFLRDQTGMSLIQAKKFVDFCKE